MTKPTLEQIDRDIVCPFCGQDQFDKVGLKIHLIRHCSKSGGVRVSEEPKPTFDQINRDFHKFLGKHFHDWDSCTVINGDAYWVCSICRIEAKCDCKPPSNLHRYSQSLDRMREVTDKIFESSLMGCTFIGIIREVKMVRPLGIPSRAKYFMFTPEQIASAAHRVTNPEVYE